MWQKTKNISTRFAKKCYVLAVVIKIKYLGNFLKVVYTNNCFNFVSKEVHSFNVGAICP